MSDLLKSLTTQRATAWEKAKTHLDTVEASGDALTGEAETTWQALTADLDTLDARLGQVTEIEKRSAAAAEAAEEFQGTPVDNGTNETGPSAGEILRQIGTGERRSHTFTPDTEKRTLSGLSGGAGGNLIPETFHGQLHEHMVASSAIRQTNVSVIQTDAGNKLLIPKTTSYSTASIVAEAGQVTASDPAFGQAELEAYKYGFLIQMSSELLADGGIDDLEGFLARQAGAAIGRGTGAHYMAGSGSGQPKGVVTAASVGVTGASGESGAFDVDDLVDLQYSVLEEYAQNGSWLMARATAGAARKFKGQDGQFIWAPGLIAGEPSTLLGRPVYTDPSVPAVALAARSVVFGDMSAYAIRDVKGIEVARSADFKFDYDLITYRFLFRTDGDLIDTTGAVKAFVGNAA